jgi:hypothetical protein
VMTPEEQQLLLGRLAKALQRGVITVELVNWFPGQPYQWLAEEYVSRSTVTARVRDYEPSNGVWLYWWLWRQPIRAIYDLERVMERFCDVVLRVEGKA